MKPLTRKKYLKIDPPGNGDIIGDKERILKALQPEFGEVGFSYDLLKTIYPFCRESNWEMTITLLKNEKAWVIVRLEAGDCSDRHYGIAVDLGSTMVAMEMVDLNTGQIIDQRSVLNHQIKYGDDILSRIFMPMESGAFTRN